MKSSKTKKVKFINKKTMLTTIDIGKNVHYGYFRTPDGHELKPFPFYNSKKCFHRFWNKMCQFKRQHQLQDIVIGFESTGPYAEPLYHYLKKKPVKLVQINPMHSKRVKEMSGNSPNKTDRTGGARRCGRPSAPSGPQPRKSPQSANSNAQSASAFDFCNLSRVFEYYEKYVHQNRSLFAQTSCRPAKHC